MTQESQHSGGTGTKRIERMTEAEADKWYKDLMLWIKKNHTHLDKRWWEK